MHWHASCFVTAVGNYVTFLTGNLGVLKKKFLYSFQVCLTNSFAIYHWNWFKYNEFNLKWFFFFFWCVSFDDLISNGHHCWKIMVIMAYQVTTAFLRQTLNGLENRNLIERQNRPETTFKNKRAEKTSLFIEIQLSTRLSLWLINYLTV